MKFNIQSFNINNKKQLLGLSLIIIAVALILYDYFSPPVGELSNFALILFSKIIAIAGSLLNINININHHNGDKE